MEEIEELRRESESKNDSVVGLMKDDQDPAISESQPSPIRQSHDKNPLLEDDFSQHPFVEANDSSVQD